MLFFGVFLRESARTAAKSRTNLSTNSGKAAKRLGRLLETQEGTWGGGGFRGSTIKTYGKLSDWHQLWFTSADSSGNGHSLNTSRPSIPQGAFGGGGLGCHKFKSLGKLSSGWTD